MASEAEQSRIETRDLGSHVRRLRQAGGWGVRELGAKAGVDPGWISKLEHGVITSPEPRTLYKLAQALDIEVAELYLVAGYADGRGLPRFAPYLRAKYDLPDEAIAQLQAHFELIHDRYNQPKGDAHGSNHRST
jgi:transcriptional regulator with XRE-family HTH domain